MRERGNNRQAFVLAQLVAHLRRVMDQLICDAQGGNAPMPWWRDWRRAESADGQP